VTAAPIAGAFMLIAAGDNTWISKRLLAHKNVVWIGLISYPLYLWHWPLLVFGRTLVQHYDHASWQYRATIALALLASFVLAWLTYRFVERPIRYGMSSGTKRLATVAASLLAVAALGFATARSDGFLMRFPADIQVLLAPAKVDEDFTFLSAPDRFPDGPLLLVVGDSHARHLLHGLRLLQDVREFRLRYEGWGCGPTPLVVIKSGAQWPGPNECSKLDAGARARIARLKPDIVVIAAFWLIYDDYVDWLREKVRFLREIGVRRIVILGSAPVWRERPQSLLFRAFINDQSHNIPTRLLGFSQKTRSIDKELRALASAAGAGVNFVSVTDVLCDDNRGCLVRLGLSADDLVQVDTNHLSRAGSDYLVRRLAHQIFGRPPTAPKLGLEAASKGTPTN
jgi:hypothetical protein